MQTVNDKKRAQTTIWILAMLCMGAVIFSLCAGAAFTAVREARLAAAKAGIGQVEAVLLLAEKVAGENGYGEAPEVYENLLKSYDDKQQYALSDQERYVLQTMLDSFGPARAFDFAVSRFRDGTGIHTSVYFFPIRGKTDVQKDRYYLLQNGVVTEQNG